MTEVEFSHLLTKLTDTAAKLNQASDSINTVIEGLEAKLHELSVGIEVWLPQSLESIEDREETGADDNVGNAISRRVSHDIQLGYTRLNDEWRLAIRKVTYQAEEADHWEVVATSDPSGLREASRKLRIEALKHFPELLKALDMAATEFVAEIDAAKKFV